MASSVNTSAIDEAYPVAGVNNDTQGFRDNFASIKTNLDAVKSELEDLQAKAVLKASLTAPVVTIDNDLAGEQIIGAEMMKTTEAVNDNGTLSGSVSLSYNDGHLQKITTSGSITLSFTNWPATGTHAKMRVWVTLGNVAHTITLPAAVSVGQKNIHGYLSNVITNGIAGDYIYEFSTVDGGTTIAVSQVATPIIGGAFVPTIFGSSAVGTPTYDTNGQVGYYVCQGGVVHFQAYIAITAIGGMTGEVKIGLTGLPIPRSTAGGVTGLFNTVSVSNVSGITVAGTQLTARIDAGATPTVVRLYSSGVSQALIDVSDIAASTTIGVSGVYFV